MYIATICMLSKNTLGIEIHNIIVIKSSVEWVFATKIAKNLKTKAICMIIHS